MFVCCSHSECYHIYCNDPLKTRPQVRKIGNSLGNIIPSAMIRQFELHEGSALEVKSDGNRIIIEPIKRDKPKFFTMNELLEGDIYTSDDNLTAEPLRNEWLD